MINFYLTQEKTVQTSKGSYWVANPCRDQVSRCWGICDEYGICEDWPHVSIKEMWYALQGSTGDLWMGEKIVEDGITLVKICPKC